jgi:DNA relaxase NicK
MDQATKERLTDFLNKVVKGKFGETRLALATIDNFMQVATQQELKELQDDFFFPWQSSVTTEDDIEMSELEDLILFN